MRCHKCQKEIVNKDQYAVKGAEYCECEEFNPDKVSIKRFENKNLDILL